MTGLQVAKPEDIIVGVIKIVDLFRQHKAPLAFDTYLRP